jgi:hypothetical protein
MPEPSADVQEARSALIRVKIGNREYDAARVPQCDTCTHPARIEIEKRLLSGHSYREIARHYSETEYAVGSDTRVFPKVGFMSIRNHFQQGHMPVEAAALRQILDERSAALSEHYDEETASPSRCSGGLRKSWSPATSSRASRTAWRRPSSSPRWRPRPAGRSTARSGPRP